MHAARGRLLLEHAAQTVHALAGDLVVHEHHVGVVLFADDPQLVEHVRVAALRVLAHGGALIAAGEVGERLIGILRVDDDVGNEGFHARHDIDAPAVFRPDGEVGVEVRRARPLDAAVAHRGGAGLFLLVAAHHDTVDAAVGVEKMRVHAAGEMVEKHAVDPERLARHLRVGRAVDLPLLQLVFRLLVVDLHGAEKRVPVEGLAGLLLDEADEPPQLLDGVVLHRLLIVADGHAEVVRREVEVPVLIRRRGDAAVARHVAGDKARAELGILVAQGAAGLGRGQGADVGRDAEVFGRVEIRRRDLLVEDGAQKHRQHLRRQVDEVREAGHDLAGDELVKEHDLLRQFVAGVEVLVGHERDAQQVGGLFHDAVVLRPGHAQLVAAHAERAAVDKVRIGQIGRKPLVAKQRTHGRHRALGHEDDHVLPALEPHVKVERRVAHAAQLAVAKPAPLWVKAVCIVIDVAEKLPQGALFLVSHGHLPPLCAWSCLISRLSTNACTRVRSWPLPPVAFCRSTATDGMP